MIGFGQETQHILHCLYRFKLTFRSRLVLGCCETCAETSTKSSFVIIRVVWKRRSVDRWEISGSFAQLVIFPSLQRPSLSREGLEYSWKQSMRSNRFSKSRTTFECIYTNTFTSKVNRGFDKPNQKLLGQDKPRLELAVGWISRERRFCTIYPGVLCNAAYFSRINGPIMF